MMVTGRQIAGARGLLGISQSKLAELADVDRVTLNTFESGKTVPRDATVDAIRQVLENRGIVFTNGDEPGVKLVPSKAIIPT